LFWVGFGGGIYRRFGLIVQRDLGSITSLTIDVRKGNRKTETGMHSFPGFEVSIYDQAGFTIVFLSNAP